jgi:hypothetical protein
MATSADLVDGSTTVKVDGNEIMLGRSKFSKSTGDEPGVNGGVASAVNMGAALPVSHSTTVKIEGEFVVRMLDLSVQNANGGGTANTPPTPLIVPPAVGGLVEQIKKKMFGSKDISFDKSEAWCGDEVKIKENYEEPPFGDKTVMNLFREGEEPLHEGVVLKVSGKSAEEKWIVRRGAYKETVKIVARRSNPGKALVESSPLTVKAPAKVAKDPIGPAERSTPQYVLDPVTNTWKPNGKNYKWEYYYEIELKPGELVVTRPMAFDLKDGCSPPSAAVLKGWEAEIAAVWDKKWRFHRKECKRGDPCSCVTANGCCNILLRVVPELGANRGGAKKVELHKGANTGPWGSASWWYSHTWWETAQGVPATVRAHEFGHLIGMWDEYPAGACDPARKYTNEPGSIMKNGSTTHERHIQEWHDWLDKKLGAFGKTVALSV